MQFLENYWPGVRVARSAVARGPWPVARGPVPSGLFGVCFFITVPCSLHFRFDIGKPMTQRLATLVLLLALSGCSTLFPATHAYLEGEKLEDINPDAVSNTCFAYVTRSDGTVETVRIDGPICEREADSEE